MYSSVHRTNHSATAFVSFVAELCAANSLVARAVIDAGFLDMLLVLAICEFADPSPFYRSPASWQKNMDALLLKCNEALSALAAHTQTHAALACHPLNIFWPREYWMLLKAPCFSRHSAQDALRARKAIWGGLDERIIARRVATIENNLDSSGIHRHFSISKDHACSDLVQLST